MRKQMEKLIQVNHRFANKLWATPKGLVFSDGYILIEWAGEKGTETFPSNYESLFNQHEARGPAVPFGRATIQEVEEVQRQSIEERRKRVDAAKQHVSAARLAAEERKSRKALAEAEDLLIKAREHVTPFRCQGAYLNPQFLLKILKILKTGTIQAGDGPLAPVLILGKDVRALIMPRQQEV